MTGFFMIKYLKTTGLFNFQENANNSNRPNNIWNQGNQGNRNNNGNDGRNQQGGGQPPQGKPSNMILLILIGLGLMFAASVFMNNMQDINKVLVPYSQFIQFVETGEVLSVSIIDEKDLSAVLKDGSKIRTLIPYQDNDLVNLLKNNNISFTGMNRPITFLQIVSTALPWLVSIIFILYMLRFLKGGIGGGGMPFTKNRIRAYVQNQGTKRTFEDVAGQDEAKYELKEVVEFLKTPEKFENLGAKIPRGVLLVGSPGTGKTLLARACAGEADVKFFYISGSDFVEMFAGVGASRVRDLFEQARKNSPCIIFIDELDAVGRSRSSGYGGGAHDEREQTLNQLLVEMDGFDERDRIIVLAATNRPDVLDQALLRPGRFDRQVVVDMPDIKEREAILKIHSKGVKLSEQANLTTIARATVGCSGADLANLINESALLAARAGKKSIEMSDLEEARDKILMGAARKSMTIDADDKLKTARHEAGHAILHFLLKNADPLHKVTVIPRGRALGVAFSLPEKDSFTKGKGYLMDRITICYGGYVAEKMYYDETTTGVQNDLQQATKLASKMVRDWGMSKLGAVSYSEKQTSLFLPVDTPTGVSASEETNRLIDKEIHNILDEALAVAEKQLNDHKDLLDTLTETLVKKETLLGDEIKELLFGKTDTSEKHGEERKEEPSTVEKPVE